MRLLRRDVPPRQAWALEQAGLHPLLARLLAARGVQQPSDTDEGLQHLLAPQGLRGAADAAVALADAIAQRQGIVVVADYDCDGATACAVALRGLKLLGARAEDLRYVVPDRSIHGYGLTPGIVDLALASGPPVRRPSWLLTVDNGLASLEGVAHARRQGLRVLVTDHHLPARQGDAVVLPEADVIVNPNQPDDSFASKHMAGVGVMFYVLLAVRAELRQRGRFAGGPEPRLDSLLDLVALGTVADVVRLDANNRRLVAQGLKRVRQGRMQAGLAALFAAAKREPQRASAFDFGFALGPRINAAGRLADMTLGIECLLTDDPGRAAELASQLDDINRERRSVEGDMREQAEALLARLAPPGAPPPAVSLFEAGFHDGVVGLVAGRLKDQLHRPTFVFAPGQGGLIKGSGRSIPGFHLRDALDLVSKREPGLLQRFGGHAMAAGATLPADGFARFRDALAQVAAEWLDAATLQRNLRVDGPLELQWWTPETVRLLDAQVWGQGFEAPLFCDLVEVQQQRLVGEKHLKMRVKHLGQMRDAIWFGRTEPVPPEVTLAYRLQLDHWNGVERLQMVVEACE
ncbi:MAG: single-stranded-DNA-specific exonuclease RecJ [Rubrivivax sp.]